MNKPRNPCYKDGQDCIERQFNCRGKCSEWDQYLKDRKKWMDEIIKNKDREYASYADDHFKRGQK